jgi:hypothetical protein
MKVLTHYLSQGTKKNHIHTHKTKILAKIAGVPAEICTM